MNSEDLQGAIIGLGVAVTMDPHEEEPAEDTERSTVVGMFFWVGWHARGAMDASGDMLKTME